MNAPSQQGYTAAILRCCVTLLDARAAAARHKPDDNALHRAANLVEAADQLARISVDDIRQASREIRAHGETRAGAPHPHSTAPSGAPIATPSS